MAVNVTVFGVGPTPWVVDQTIGVTPLAQSVVIVPSPWYWMISPSSVQPGKDVLIQSRSKYTCEIVSWFRSPWVMLPVVNVSLIVSVEPTVLGLCTMSWLIAMKPLHS
jgi:hypothetical protein